MSLFRRVALASMLPRIAAHVTFRLTFRLSVLALGLLLETGCDSAEYEPEYAELLGPVEGEVFDTESTILLRWLPAPRAASYLVQLSPDLNFAEIGLSQRVGITTLEVGPLAKGRYYWRVIALELGKDEGETSPARSFVVEDQRIIEVEDTLVFTFDAADVTGLRPEFASTSPMGIQGELARLGISNAEIRSVMPGAITIRRDEPSGVSLNQVGPLDFLLASASGRSVTAAVLNNPPLSAFAPMTIVADTIHVSGEPQGFLQITPAANVPAGAYRLLVPIQANVLVVVP